MADFSSVLDKWKAKKVLPYYQFSLLDAKSKAMAFSMVGQADTKFLTEVRDSITYALTEGLTFNDWYTSFQAIAGRFGATEGTASYMDTVFTTAFQGAYNGGKVSSMWSAERQEIAPYWQFAAVMDDRTTDECAALDGTIFRKDDSDAMDYIPPLDFNCRSSLVELDEKDIAGSNVSYGNTIDIEKPAFDNQLLTV